MEKRISKFYPQRWLQISILLGFCLVLFFLNLNRWDLWNPDEPRYAQVAKEMVSRGDWILMHYNGRIYPDKPPLFFWLIAFSSFLWQGFSSFSVRFPAALFGTLTVLLTFFLGKTLYSTRTGFLSGLILATSFLFAYLSTRADIDTTLTFFTTASLLCFFRWYRDVRDEAKNQNKVEIKVKVKDRNRNRLIYGFYIAMALATLAKGPVGFVLPLLVSLVYLSIQKDWKGISEMKLLPGMLLFAGIVLSWYLPALVRGGEDYLHMTLFKHTIGRYSEGWAKPRPIYCFPYNFPVAGGYFYTSSVILPLVNQFKSARFTSQEITARIQPGEKLGVYGRIGAGPYNFYTGIVPIMELNKTADLLSFLRSSERVFCLIDFREFSNFLKIEGRPSVQLISRRRVGNEEIFLVSNR